MPGTMVWTGLNFGEVIARLDDGDCVTRPAWQGAYLYLERDVDMEVRTGLFEGMRLLCAPVICFIGPGGMHHEVGWRPSQADMFATDWQTVPEEPGSTPWLKHPDVTE